MFNESIKYEILEPKREIKMPLPKGICL
ncbi:uncharacterized protein METZ01_LOCUS233424, partial [marine metagenome]